MDVTSRSRVQGLRDRLRDESGFTLIELLSAQIIGGFVLAAAISMIFIAMGSASRVTDRVNSAAQGRIAMEELQQRLRSQTCLYSTEFKLNGATQATASSVSFVHADPTKIVFFTDIGKTNTNTAATSAVSFSPQMRYLYVDPGPTTGQGANRRAKWIDGVKLPTGPTSVPFTFDVSPYTRLADLATGITGSVMAPTTQRAFAEGVTNEVSGATSLPFFKFYDAAGVEVTSSVSSPVPAANLGSIDQVNINFSILGLSGKDNAGPSAATSDDRTAAFSDTIYLKTPQTACE